MNKYLTEKLKRMKIYFGSYFLDDTIHCGGRSMKEQLCRWDSVMLSLSVEAGPGGRGEEGQQGQTLNPTGPPLPVGAHGLKLPPPAKP